MSKHNDEDKHKKERSIKLCQLVYDRKIDDKISFEIKKLLQVVDIDYQNKDRNNRTVIHLAVEKCDLICVESLLNYRPNLGVKDEDGKTPIQLARLSDCQNILNVLLNSTANVVNDSFVAMMGYKRLTPQSIEKAISSRPTIKVLTLTYCPSVNHVWTKLNDQSYTAALIESSHLFFIAIETKETNVQNDHELMKKALNLRRSMIVQLTSSNSRKSKIYFKDGDSEFVEITETPQTALITQVEFNKAVKSSKCNFKLLFEGLRSNLFGKDFTGNLLDTKLNTNEDRSEVVNQFAKRNALCYRFFKLFEEELVDEGQPQIDRIVAALTFRSDQSLLALLDLPFEPKFEIFELNENQQKVLSVVDSSDYNLLMLAAKQNNLDALKLLLRCGCDFNRSDNYEKRASDICWGKNAFDYLAELIEAGSPYPNNFYIDRLGKSSEAHKRINAMIEATNSLHESIKQGKAEEVEKFITSHPHIKHAYDTKNKCSLTVALQSKQVDIHYTLRVAGFIPGVDDEYFTVLNNFKDKNEITKSYRKYFREALDEPHLQKLLKKCKLSRDSKDRAKCSTTIRRMFNVLNEIDEAIPILQISSLSKTLQIVFDFNCESVVDMDPTRKTTEQGLTYPDGFVYIGSKKASNNKKPREFLVVIGTLIHELTHHAMPLTYENDFKPYKVGGEKKFETEIASELKKIFDKNPDSIDSIVSTAFSLGDDKKLLYEPEFWHQELIARVPHLLAHRKTDSKALEAAELNLSKLFTFYREKTVNDVAAKYEALLQEYLFGKINIQTGIAQNIKNLKVEFEKAAIDLKSPVCIITSNAPLFTLTMLMQVYPPNFHIFVSLEQIALEQVALENISKKIAEINAKESLTALIVNCIGKAQKYQESLRKLMKSMKNVETIALVMTLAESSKVKENFPKVELKTLTHNWAELTESSKVHLLDQKVFFQGVEMKLNELVESSSEAMNFFPLGELVDCKDFEIGHKLPQRSHNFYIPRKFIQKGQESSTRVTANARNFEDLLRIESRMGSMIISDEAGSGKSVALIEIGKSLHGAFRDRWVLFVDLKRHIEAFKTVEDHDKIESLEDFIVQNILKNELEFDRKLFVQMFRAGKTFVLLDSFDEICPNYKKLLLNVLKWFEPESGNQIFITTRPHLEADLECALGEFVFKIEEFSKVDKKSFLREHWQSVGFEIGKEDFEVLSLRLLDKFSKFSTSNIIGFPLLLRMTAEIFYDPIKESLLNKGKVDSLSVSSVFRKFVEKYFARWTNNENEISRGETVEFQMTGGVLEVHHRIAINHIFDDEFMSVDVEERGAEKISRVGLIRYFKAEKTFQFIHETFAEYFVADFIWFHLDRNNRDPSHDCSKAVEILIEVLLIGEFSVIKTFLDQTLETVNFNPSESFCKSVEKCLSEIVQRRNSFDFLVRNFDFLVSGLFDSGENLARLLLSIVRHVEKKILLKILQSKGSFETSVLHNLAINGSKATVSTLCDIITTCTDKPKEIYQDECRFGNVLFRAANNKNAEVLTTLCQNLNSVLTKNDIKTMFQKRCNLENIVERAKNSADEVFLELISLLPNYLSLDEIKSLLLAEDDPNPNFFHRAVSDDANKSLKVKFDVMKSNFGLEEQKIFFYKPAVGPNMFHCAAQNRNVKTFETLIESTRDVLSVDEIKSMLMQKDSDGSNVLHKIAYYGNEVVLNELNLLLRERLSYDEIRSLLLEVNGWGQNCFRLAANNTKLGLQVFCEIIGNLLQIEDQTRLLQQSIHEIDIFRFACGSYNTNEILPLEAIKQLLTKKDKFGRNAFHKANEDGNVETWNNLISFTQARFSADEMKSFLFCFDRYGQNCLHRAVYSRPHANMIEAICKTIKAVLSDEEQKKLVRQKDFRNRNVFHLTVESSWTTKSKLFELYDGLSVILSYEEKKEMLKEKDSDGHSILCCFSNRKSSFRQDESISADLISFLQKVLTNDEVKNFLFDVDREGKSCFSCAVEVKSKFEIKSLSKSIKKILSREDQKKFFGIKSPNVFHLAMRNSKTGVFSTLHECLKDVFDADELKTLVTSSDNRGCNALLLAAQFRDQLLFEELLNFIQSELSLDDQRSLIQKCDNDENNIFTFVSRNKVPEVYFVIENYAKEILSKNQIKKLKNRNRFVSRVFRKIFTAVFIKLA